MGPGVRDLGQLNPKQPLLVHHPTLLLIQDRPRALPGPMDNNIPLFITIQCTTIII